MDDIIVFKTTYDMGDRISLTDMSQELVTKPLSL